MIDYKFLVENFYYRLSMTYPKAEVECGWGCANPSLVVIQDDTDFGSIRFVLKYMGLLNHTFITPITIISERTDYYLRELVDLLQPLLVVAAGSVSVATLRGSKSRQFSIARHRGRPFLSSCLDRIVFPVYAPKDHISKHSHHKIRANAKKDWYTIQTQLVTAQADNLATKWGCPSEETLLHARQFFGISS